jgi:LPPG:FO 2-phospho-L-lactate transferase
VRTRVLARGRWVPFQEFMIRERGEGPVDGVELQGIEAARAPQAVLDAIASARAVILGPSNPVISVRTILEVPGVSDAVRAAAAPVVAVSPIVGGQVLKGPTAAFMAWAGLPVSAAGTVRAYDGLLDGIVADEPVEDLPALQTDTRMDDADARRRLAEDVLRFAEAL